MANLSGCCIGVLFVLSFIQVYSASPIFGVEFEVEDQVN